MNNYISCDLLSNDNIFNTNIDLLDSELNDLKRLNKYYQASNTNYIRDVIDFEKHKIIKLLKEINERIEYNNKNKTFVNIDSYKNILCEYEIEYKTSIKYLKNKLLFLESLHDNHIKINNHENEIQDLKTHFYKNDEIIKIDIGKLKLDSSFHINDVKKDIQNKFNELLGLIIIVFVLLL